MTFRWNLEQYEHYEFHSALKDEASFAALICLFKDHKFETLLNTFSSHSNITKW